MSSEPKYATRRTSANPSYGRRIEAMAAYMGGPLMPWQKQVAAVGMELDPRQPGAFRYNVVVVSVPRQSGKSYLLRAIMADRIMSYNRHEVVMTAQTGKDAKKRWTQLIDALKADKKPGYFSVRKSQGTEYLEYLKRGSRISPFAPTPKSVHGDSLHLVTVDEAWAFDADSGAALEAAIEPTQLTILDSQIWIVSTRGTSKSAYLNTLIERGRQAVSDPTSRLAYFEWSADEELAEKDPYGEKTLAFHPAMGHTQTYEKILSLAKPGIPGALANWRRSILNLDTPLENETLIDMALWDSLAADQPLEPPAPSDVSIGVDIALDRSGASIVAAWVTDEGDLALSLIMSGPGVDWVAPTVRRLSSAGYKWIGVDATGPMATTATDITNSGAALEIIKTKDYALATQLLLDRVRDGRLVHDGATQLRTAWGQAACRPMYGVMALDASRSAGPIDALRAAATAVHGAGIYVPDPVQLY